ncbi:DMT family transporter [Aliisedimentitalea scapharcae]|uniref:DMT family transporter n=1 Tax=Aliisedimentitalea scapharcae TaxID=1524259 RepID=A0ABZ2XTF7_9RHOB
MNDVDHGRRANLIGSLWMVAAMAGFAIEDVFLKVAAQTLSISQILMMFGAGGAAVFALWARATGDALVSRAVMSRPMRIRVVFEILGRLFYVLAIALTPLSAATVILQATPIVVVAGAALFLGERVGWRRWAAILVGLLGVIVIIQPGADSFSILSLLAVLGMFGFAGRDLASRAAPASLGTPVLGVYGFLAVIVAGALFSLWEARPLVLPDAGTWGIMAGAVIAGVAAYSALMKAMRTGDVSAVTPFRYTRLLFGIGCGVVLFGETLSVAMLIGCGLIVVSGLFILWRSNSGHRAA